MSAQSVAPDILFGIRIGEPLEQQFGECPKNAQGAYETGFHKGNTPCWFQDTYEKRVKLPLGAMKETGYALNGEARIKTHEGNVVEIDLYAHGKLWRQVERYLMRHYGKPAASETYERDSRVSGLSKVQSHTWRANGVTMYFDERSSSDDARIRAVSDVWNALDSKRLQEGIRNRSSQ